MLGISTVLAFLSVGFMPEKKAEVADKPKADPFALNTLISWLETKTGAYHYGSNENCLIAQYFRAQGVPFKSISGWNNYSVHGQIQYMQYPMDFSKIASALPRTFPAALARAKKLGEAT